MPGARRGFSLIELLIVVAIIAALVGVAVPFFNSYMREARAAKLEQDLDLLVSAINRFQFESRSLLGGSNLARIVGHSLQELPTDPWGNAYFFDGNLGVVGSFGADGIQGGEGEDGDVARQFAREIAVLSATLSAGGYGFATAQSRLDVQFNKPVGLAPGFEHVSAYDLVVVPPIPITYGVALYSLGFKYDPVNSRPEQGRLSFTGANLPPLSMPIIEGSRVTFSTAVAGIFEKPAPATETGLVDPRPYLRGPQVSIDAQGDWIGPRVTR